RTGYYIYTPGTCSRQTFMKSKNYTFTKSRVSVDTRTLFFSIAAAIDKVRFDHRPDVDPYCQALCILPYMRDSDVISVFRLQAPVWEFKYGDLLGKFVSTPLHYNSADEILVSIAIYDFLVRPVCTGGIDDVHWLQNGTLEKVGEISGRTGLRIRNGPRTTEDNGTGIYYETWTVKSDPGANSTVWFESYDCSQFVHRTYRKLAELGALATDIRNFYSYFQPHHFYLFYNFEYWHLPMKPPYIQITYEEVPLPR
uniref:Bis(monoacylglycero)phosphate synthase CLN5 n=1 Tax=Denticeps clupeoides TaxID=299321 RepID=A0AAY4B7J0_9TELE